MIGRQPVHDRSILDLKMPLSEYWLRQCYAIYQSSPIGVKLIDEIGEDNIMWARTSRTPTGCGRTRRNTSSASWPTRCKFVCDNAARLYRFVN